MNVRKFIEAHQEEFGVALFVIPMLALVLAIAAVGCSVALLLG